MDSGSEIKPWLGTISIGLQTMGESLPSDSLCCDVTSDPTWVMWVTQQVSTQIVVSNMYSIKQGETNWSGNDRSHTRVCTLKGVQREMAHCCIDLLHACVPPSYSWTISAVFKVPDRIVNLFSKYLGKSAEYPSTMDNKRWSGSHRSSLMQQWWYNASCSILGSAVYIFRTKHPQKVRKSSIQMFTSWIQHRL